MKFKGLPYCLGLLSLGILLNGAPGADAEERYPAWSARLRVGPSFLSQGPIGNTNIEGQIEPLLNGLMVYALNKHVSLGV